MGVANAEEEAEDETLEFPFGCQIYFSAFYALDSQRPAAMESLMPIPTNAILIYCREMGMDEEQRQVVGEVVRRMDVEYLKIKNKKGSMGKVKGKPNSRKR